MAVPERTSHEFPDALRALMRERQLTLRAIERASGIDNAFLSRMLRGKKAISVGALVKISTALGLPDDYFLEVRRARVYDWLRRDADALDEIYDRHVDR